MRFLLNGVWTMMITVRLEEEKDYRIAEEVAKEAFSYPERIERSKIGCCLEHYIVHSLREKDGINELSFVAEIDNKIVGHIIYSKAYILQPNGTSIDVVSFGPLSVLPEYQKQGVGTALKKHSIELKKDYLKDVTGKFYEAPIYDDDLNREKAKKFDKQFSKLYAKQPNKL